MPRPARIQTPPEMSQDDRDKALASAYNAASQHLREEHRDEFNKYYSEEAKERGVVWEPRLSPEQRAEKELAELLERFPHLADRFRVDEPADPDPETDPDQHTIEEYVGAELPVNVR